MYEGIIYRPPSEGRSLILQVTVGCSHNKCTFCSMYKDKKFRMKSLEEIKRDIKENSKYKNHVERVFLADGDALILKTEMLVEILRLIKKEFPKCRRISSYATPRDILNKGQEQLDLLKSEGLDMLYMGVESGSDIILKDIKKGVTSKEICTSGKMVKKSGMKLSVTLISGIGGREKWKSHALESARVMNEIRPDYIGLLTLMKEKGTELFRDIKEGKFTLLEPMEIMEETYTFIKELQLEGCIFRSNHASNYVNLSGELNKDKEYLCKKIEDALKGKVKFKKESYRGL